MNLVHKIETWGNAHHPVVLDPIRIALGIFLVFKGVSFMNNTPMLHSIIANQNTLPDGVLMTMVYIATFVHIVGGIMVALGVLTRIASLIQIPFVLAGIIIATSVELPINTEIALAVVVIVLLGVFSVVGSGKLSIQTIMESQNTIFS
jgi:uncharacterized membrane protein YphA (DoxX/SURF4 family)